MSIDKDYKGVILIVDDNPTNLDVLSEFLSSAGLKVLVAEDGESALETVKYASLDLILLDVLMPGIDGFETCRRLQANESTKDIPIIFMTALTEPVDKVKGLKLGAVDYITKPLQHEEVLARVNIHLRLQKLTKRLTEQNKHLEQEIQQRKQIEEKLRQHSNELTDWTNRYEAVIQASDQIFYDWNSQTNELSYGGALERILGYSIDEMSGNLTHWFELIHPEDQNLFKQEIHRVLATKEPFHLEYRLRRQDNTYITVEDKGYFFVESTGNTERMVGFVVDISDRKQAESLVSGQTRVLEMIATGAELPDILDTLARLLEAQSSGMLCSILILDQNGKNLRHGAAPSLPATYISAVDGLLIGSCAGSCGTAAYLAKPIIVTDIASDPLWIESRDLALSHDLRACWSIPIISTNNKVLGTFGMYYREPKSPNIGELKLAEIATHIAGIAIERQQAQTEQERAFIALQESEGRFRCLVEANIIGIILVELSGNIKEANDAFLQMVGYTREELQAGKLHWPTITPPEYRHLDAKASAELSNSGVCTPFEKEYICKDGSRLPVMVGGTLIDKSQPNALCFVLDLTERKQADRKIREQAALLDITTDAILVRDLDNQILFWNKGAEHLYGWEAEFAIGKNANQLLYKEILPQHQKRQKTIVEQGEWQGELHQITKEGKAIIVASRWTLVRDEEGEPKYILTVSTDITEKKHLETQFLRAQRLESVGTLASGIAHDLNNSLAPILMAIHLLEKKLKDDQSQLLLKTLESNTKRSADLVKQVLSFTRGVEGKHAVLQIEELIIEVEQIVKQIFPKNIEVRTNLLSENIGNVSGDATQLHQVLMNLCVNARDAMPDGGTLEITARNEWIDENYVRLNLDAKVGAYVLLTVADTGTGMPREIIDKVFEPFFTTKELGKGTGLGLSTVMGIIKSHGGFIKVYSEVSGGTKFNIFLPSTQTKTSLKNSDSGQKLAQGQGELILVVDDEAPIRETTRIMLEANAYKVIVANDGVEAISLYTQHKSEISVVVMDMMMPSMDGPTTIRVLERINPEVKIVAVSGLSTNQKRVGMSSRSIKTFLLKPYTADELLKSLQTAIYSEEVLKN